MKVTDWTGRRHVRLVGVRRVENIGRCVAWLFRCDCGNEVVCRSDSPRESCGCLLIEQLKDSAKHMRALIDQDARTRFATLAATTHGQSRSATYYAWQEMRRRCKKSPYYIGRVSVCPEWDASFEQFLEDMGEKPSGMTLDRIDNDGDYRPGNCRWADWKTQSRNKSTTKTLTVDGETKCLADWAAELNVCRSTVSDWVFKGQEYAVSMVSLLRAKRGSSTAA